MRTRFAFVVAIATAVSPMRAAYAGDAGTRETTVSVVPSACAAPPWEPGPWLDLLRVELAADGVTVRAASEPDRAGASVTLDATTCDDPASSATLSFVSGAIRQTRTLDLRDIAPVARARVVAIAMADLVRSGLAAPDVKTPAPQPRSAELVVRVELVAPETREPHTPERTRLFAAGESRVFGQGATLFGGRVGVAIPMEPHVGLVLDGGGLADTSYDPLGAIDTTVATLAASVLLTGGAYGASFGVGPRLDGGLGWFHASATTPSTRASEATSGLAFLSLSAIASFPVAGWFSGFASIDAGTTLYGFSARADDRHVSDISGATLALRIGVVLARPVATHNSQFQ